MSLEPGGGYFGNLNIVQLYEDSVDLGQVILVQHPTDNKPFDCLDNSYREWDTITHYRQMHSFLHLWFVIYAKVPKSLFNMKNEILFPSSTQFYTTSNTMQTPG